MKILQWFLDNSKQIFKSAWWLIILATSTRLLIVRFSEITSKEPVPFDLGLIGFIAVLLLLPFISEVSAFGFTVKKQIEQVKQELKQDIKDETQSIRNEILAIGISNRLTSSVVVQNTPNPPPDSALSSIRDQISEVVKQFQTERGIRELPKFDERVSENTIYAFTQRYLIEKEVKRIWNTRVRNGDVYRYPPFPRMVDDLSKYEVATSNLGGLIKEVFSIASPAIHGEEPSQEKIEFLKEVCPEIIATLKAVR